MESTKTRPLLIIDVQKAFINEHTRSARAAADQLQHQYTTVYASRHLNSPDSSHRRYLGWTKCAPGSAESELAFQAADHVKVFTKTRYSAAVPQLLDELRAEGFHEIDVCGINTEGCVLETAIALFEAGIRPRILEEACGSTGGPRYHEAGLMIAAHLTGSPEPRQTGRAGGRLSEGTQKHQNAQTAADGTCPDDSGIDR